MSHAARIVISAVHLLLIKPSWWARAGAGTQYPPDRSQGMTPLRGQPIQESRRALGHHRHPCQTTTELAIANTYRQFAVRLTRTPLCGDVAQGPHGQADPPSYGAP